MATTTSEDVHALLSNPNPTTPEAWRAYFRKLDGGDHGDGQLTPQEWALAGHAHTAHEEDRLFALIARLTPEDSPIGWGDWGNPLQNSEASWRHKQHHLGTISRQEWALAYEYADANHDKELDSAEFSSYFGHDQTITQAK